MQLVMSARVRFCFPSSVQFNKSTFRIGFLGVCKNVCRRLFISIAFLTLVFFVLPVSLRLVLYVFERPTPKAYSNEIPVADMASIGLLPAAEKHPSARVLILSAPLSGQRGEFLTHTWIVLKRAGAPSWSRYEVLGFASRDADGAWNGRWIGNSPTLNGYAPDGRWFGRSPTVIADVEGTTAASMIPTIEAVIKGYEATAGHYRAWPGPNSNTFVEAILRAVPELRASLPPTAIGKDFKPGIFFGLTDSRTGFEAGLWGLLGVKVGWVEGVEVNLFSLIAGLDLRQPALKLPGFGRIDLTASRAVTMVTSDDPHGSPLRLTRTGGGNKLSSTN